MTETMDREGRLLSSTEFSGKTVRTEYRDAAGTITTVYGDGTSTVITRDKAD